MHELLWFTRGDTNAGTLRDNGVTLWDERAEDRGELGSVDGRVWRSWDGADGCIHDQLRDVPAGLGRDADNRRLIVSAWNVADLDRMALAPCHCLFQLSTEPRGRRAAPVAATQPAVGRLVRRRAFLFRHSEWHR